MDTPTTERVQYFYGGKPIEIWSAPAEFSFGPDALRRYIDKGRWDLVFNALCYMTGAVDEGSA